MYPALAVLKALTEAQDGRLRTKDERRRTLEISDPSSIVPGQSFEVLWVGGIGSMDADLIKREGVPFVAIPAAGVHGVGLRALPYNLWQVGRGFLAARRLLHRFRPEVMFFTGGYLAVPVALASRLPGTARLHPANLLYVPDIEPGLALRTLARYADHIALTAEDSKAFFSPRNPLTVTGYPTRRELQSWTSETARRVLNISPEIPTVLVFGGSKGARSINRALLSSLPDLLAEMQIIHVSGYLDWPEVESSRAGLNPRLKARYLAYPYLHSEMGAAMRVADLVVSRAGASSLGEFPLFGLPAVLVPYPHAWRYQEVNAHYLAERGAALILADADLPTQLVPTVKGLIADPPRRNAMRRAMLSLSHPEAAESIATLLLRLAPMQNKERN